MNANTIAPLSPPPAPRFDAKFIEDHQLIERYLQNKLPSKGARDLENWCRANPEYLEGLNLPERTQASLKLLEASGKPVDLSRWTGRADDPAARREATDEIMREIQALTSQRYAGRYPTREEIARRDGREETGSG